MTDEHESLKIVTFKIEFSEALLATMVGNEEACEHVRKIMYRRVDDFIAEALRQVYS